MEISKATITNEKNVTADDILAEANSIWAECKRIWSGQKPMADFGRPSTQKGEQITIDDDTKLDKLFDIVRQTHSQLYQAYPLVLRHMVQEQYYNSDVFKMYLHKIEVHPWTNDAERLDSYTDYFVMLYKKTHPKYSNSTVNYLYNDYRRRLQTDHDNFITQLKKIEEEVAKKHKEYEAACKHELINKIKKMIENNEVTVTSPPIVEDTTARDELNGLIDDLVMAEKPNHDNN